MVVQWNAGLIELMFEGQVEAALAPAKLLLGGRLHRIDTTVKEGEYSLDDARPEKIGHLINPGRGEPVKKQNLHFFRERYLNGKPVAPFSPLHRPMG